MIFEKMKEDMCKSLADSVRGVGGSLLTDHFGGASEVFAIVYDEASEDYKFQKIVKPRGARCDPHRHSYYSSSVLGSGTTNLLGVKESYAPVHKILRRTMDDGMDIHSIQDHNDIRADADRRRFEAKHEEVEHKTFMSCEYDVRVPGKKTVHVGVWGLDYPFQTPHRLTQKDVRGLHFKLERARNRNVEHFRKVCDEEGLIAVLNHPPWMSTPKRPLSGEDLSHICDVFDYLEINGDGQKENLFTLELAQQKRKILVAGSDLHNLRSSMVFTETIQPVDYAWEFLQAVKKGEVAIGSTHKLSKSLDTPFDVLRSHFNGTRMDMYSDIYRGVGNYFAKDWKNKRKWATLGVIGGATVGGAYVWAPLLAIPLLASAWLAFAMPIKYGYTEKSEISKRTVSLYNDYQDFRLHRKLDRLKEELPEEEFFSERDRLEQIIEDRKVQFEKAHFRSSRRAWEKVAEQLVPTELKTDYDFSDRLDEEEPEEQ